MHSRRIRRRAAGLFMLCVLAALAFAGLAVWGRELTPIAAAVALVLAMGLWAGAIFVHDALREARWNAGHRVW
jgi:hypothetical protein